MTVADNDQKIENEVESSLLRNRPEGAKNKCEASVRSRKERDAQTRGRYGTERNTERATRPRVIEEEDHFTWRSGPDETICLSFLPCWMSA